MVTREVMGQKVEVKLEPGMYLSAKVGDEEYSGYSWESLEPKLKKAIVGQRVEHAIDVVVIYDGTAQRAILRGRKVGGGRHFLFTINGKKVAIDPLHVHLVALGSEMTDEQIARLNGLNAAAEAAYRVAQDYRYSLREKKRHISCEDLLSAATDAAIAAEAETATVPS